MKYLKFRHAYKTLQKIQSIEQRAMIISKMSPEFRHFYDMLAIHKLEKLSRAIIFITKKMA